MRLATLIGKEGAASAIPELEITGLTSDSRAVRPGFLFAALQGTRDDGAVYINDAIANGAVAILTHLPVAANCNFPLQSRGVHILEDRNPRRLFALLAARFFAEQPAFCVAITGTNGKTSVADFCRQIWLRLGKRAASIGTLGVIGADISKPAGHVHTTPPPEILYSQLAQLCASGISHVALEASSHGLAQYRLDGVRLMASALTNITRDHLDYHADEADYVYSKLRLFGEVMAPGGLAVLNQEDSVFSDAEALAWARGHRIVSVGGRFGDARISSSELYPGGQRLQIAYAGREWDVNLPLIGRFQAMNALTAAALVIGCGEDADDVFGVLPELAGVPGRLECIGFAPCGAPVLVDYAHTPDALRTVLQTVRPFVQGKLHLVFGCGGERDAGKRPQMGAVAFEFADHVIVTDDNPRSEYPAVIRAQILAACPNAREIGDRAEAIRGALAALRQGDMLLIAGKGHETGQEIAGKIYPFDDRMQAAALINALGGVRL